MKHFKHPGMGHSQSQPSLPKQSPTMKYKQQRTDFLQELDMKRKYFKSSYQPANKPVEFKSHNSPSKKMKVKQNLSKTSFGMGKNKHGKKFAKGSLMVRYLLIFN